MYNFLYQNVCVFSLYILLRKKTETFWSTNFGLELSAKFEPAKSYEKNPQNLPRF